MARLRGTLGKISPTLPLCIHLYTIPKSLLYVKFTWTWERLMGEEQNKRVQEWGMGVISTLNLDCLESPTHVWMLAKAVQI